MPWCRHERCKIIELHEAHDEDFARPSAQERNKRQAARLQALRERDGPRTKIERLVAFKPPLYRDLIKCPECKGSGIGCEPCGEHGELLYASWLRWRKNC